jgi:hypothetical protein
MIIKKNSALARRPINASSSITGGIQRRSAQTQSHISASVQLTPAQSLFARQLRSNCSRTAITAATNTTNIAARPDFLELLPLFVQKLLILDVFGSVAMRSRQQLIPYFKYIAENTKGDTHAGDILSSPYVNRQGIDQNFTGRVVKNEVLASTAGAVTDVAIAYHPVLPGSVTIVSTVSGTATPYTDDGLGNIVNGAGATKGSIDYASGAVNLTAADITLGSGDTVKAAAYQYDNENVGPDKNGKYGAQMSKGYLQLDEINLVAQAHQIANYWSIYSAFAAQQEYGGNIADLAKEAAFAELTAEINTAGFQVLADVAAYKPQFNWDASPVLTGSVVPSDYLNMFKLKLNQAAAAIYQATRLSQPNRLIVGSNVGSYISMINTFVAEGVTDNVGPYKLGQLDNFGVYLDPNYDPNTWVMACKSNDIRRNSALFGEYMPFTDTAAIGLADASVQQGYATMYAMEAVNPASVASGKIVGVY